MAQLHMEPVSTGKKNRTRKAQLKIDMTPMVDLGFLLITFFIFTTTMSKPYETDLVVPDDTQLTTNPSQIPKSKALTILISSTDSIYYYHGKWEEALKSKQIPLTNCDETNGIGKVIRDKQKFLGNERNELLLMIKPLDNSSYNSLMNALDEVLINDVNKYAIMDVTQEEKNWVAQSSKH